MKILHNIPLLLAALTVSAVAVFVVIQVTAGSTTASGGPVAIVWDHEPCAHCRMHLGEPAFAAQLQTGDGRVMNFDDPGCAFELLAARGGELEVQALYFRHCREDRWLPAERTAFARVAQSPMGFGFGAVDLGTPEAVPLEQARAEVTRRKGP